MIAFVYCDVIACLQTCPHISRNMKQLCMAGTTLGDLADLDPSYRFTLSLPFDAPKGHYDIREVIDYRSIIT